MTNVPESSKQARISRESIVQSAISIADREGLDAVTIRRLARDAGVTPMALYWHFRDKDLLLNGIAANIFENVDVAADPDGAWDVRLHAVLRSFLASLRPHPSVVELLSSRILDSEAGLALTERVLSLIGEAGFSREQTAEISGYLLSACVALVMAEPGPPTGLTPAERDAQVRAKKASLRSLDPAHFPNIVASADSLALCIHVDAYYSRGIDLLVRGTKDIQLA